MSTTLTNGIIIPDNGNRNWGGDLANNWNILDVHVGYMNDVKNKVTTLETSVAENTANIQTNASNISALQTSKQDVIEDLETIRTGASSGATAVQPSALSDYYTKSEVDANLSSKANDADVVHKSGGETVGGIKTFIDDLYMKANNFDPTEPSGIGGWFSNALRFTGNKGGMLGALQGFKLPDNKNSIILFVKNSDSTSDGLFKFDDTGSFHTKALNDINPGALSLPNCGDRVEVTSQVVDTDGVFRYTNNLYDGWLVVTALADNAQIANQYFECRAVKSIDNVVTAIIPLRFNETASIRFTNFTRFAYVNLFSCSGNA